MRLSSLPAPSRLGIFVLTLLLIWLPLAAPIYLLVKDSNLISLLTLPILYIEFLLLVHLWGKNVYQKSNLLKIYGLHNTRKNGFELLIGLSFGVIVVFSLFGLEGICGWLQWHSPTGLSNVIISGFLVALPLGFAEETLFRGWLLHELETDYTPKISLLASAIIFATLHFIKPLTEIIRTLPGFPGLVLLGVTLVWAKRSSQGRLGLSIGLHGGLVWGYYIINVGQLIKYSGQVPDWLTGVDKNPLAGIIGLLFLSAIALLMKKRYTLVKSSLDVIKTTSNPKNIS